VHIATDDIEYYVDIARVFFEWSLVVGKYFLSPESAHKIDILLRTCRNHRRAAQTSNLDRHATDTSGSGMYQHAHSRLHIRGLHQPNPRTDARERQ
jgi:hypothetical protein